MPKFEPIEVKVSWSQIEAAILTYLAAIKVIPDYSDKVPLAVSLKYPGGFQPQDKQIPVRIIYKEEEVQVLRG